MRSRLYAGGVAGDDPDVVRKTRLGTLNGGVLTSAGVAEIDKSVYALLVPMMYSGYDEVYAVLERMRPSLKKARREGLRGPGLGRRRVGALLRAAAGATPDEPAQVEAVSWAGDTEGVELMKAAKFNPIPLPSTELSTALQTGLVQAFGAPPQVTVIAQYYNHAKFMTDLDWQLLLGAVIVNQDTWNKIPADLQPKLKEARRNRLPQTPRSDPLGRQGRRRSDEAARPDGRAGERRSEGAVAEAGHRPHPKVRGPIVPADAFDLAVKFRDEIRAGK